MMVWLLFVGLVLPTQALQQKKTAKKSAPAKAKPAPAVIPSKWPVERITVEGNRNYTQEQVIAASGLRIGQQAGKEEFEAARDRLIASGVFESVGYRFFPAQGSNGYAATFQVIEVEPVYPVRFDRMDLSDDELKAWLRGKDPFFGDKIPATKPILEKHARAIEELYASKNRKEPVIGKVIADAPDRFSVVFRPATPEPAVAEVKFEGNEVVPSAALLASFSSAAFGAPYREPGFRQMLDAGVRPIYETRGRIMVQWTKIRTEKAAKVDGVLVIVTVDEGPSFDLGKVTLEGNPPVKDLLKAGGFKSGDIANFDEVNAGIERMKKQLRRDGFLRCEIQTERSIQEKSKTVDLSLRVTTGPQFTFDKLAIEGLDINGEAAVKKIWAMKQGKPFNAEYPDYFLQRVREDGLFDDLGETKAVQKVDEQEQRVDVTLIFRAPPTKPGEGLRTRGARRPR